MSIGPSIREQAICAVIDQLRDFESPAPNTFRSRLSSIRQDQLPCYDVSPAEEKIEQSGDFSDRASVTRKLTVSVRAILDAARAQDETDNTEIDLDDSGLDRFYCFAVQALTGGLANLGGLVDEVVELDNKSVFQPEGRDIIGLEMSFEITFATKRGDPTQKG